MSSIRRRHSLGGTDGLCEHAGAQLALHGITHNQVDPAAKNLLKAFLHTKEVEETDWLCEFDEQVNVAVGAGITAGNRPEQVERAHAETSELGSHVGKALLNLFARHISILG
jgi:hypothetical protein